MSFTKFKKQKLKKEKRRMDNVQTQQPINKHQMLAQLNQQYQNLTQSVHTAAAQYANGYINVANRVAEKLFLENENFTIETAIEKGFEFAKAFEVAQKLHVEAFKAATPIDSNLIGNIQQLEQVMASLTAELEAEAMTSPAPKLAEVVNINGDVPVGTCSPEQPQIQ